FALSIRICLEQLSGGGAHGGLRLLANSGNDLFGDQAEGDHLGGDAGERVAFPPGGFLLLTAVAERAAGVWTVLVEEAVDLGLDDGGAATGTQHLFGLLGGQVHRERVHAVDAPGRDAEPESAGGEP